MHDEELPEELKGRSLVIKKASSCSEPLNIEDIEVAAVKKKG